MIENWIKLIFILIGYGVIAPMWGIAIRRSQRAQDWTLGLLVFLFGIHINHTVLVLGSIEWYRGVTKGYEFTIMEVVALALWIGSFRARGSRSSWLPPGTLLWFCYCAASFLSIASALDPNYVLMSLVKFSKVWIIAMALHAYIRAQREVHVFLLSASVMIFFQTFFVFKMKFIDRMHQVPGLFEHQNPLAMFTYMISLVLLGAAMAPRTPVRNLGIYFAAFACGGFIILASLSRASLAVFGVGTIIIIFLGVLNHFTLKRGAVVMGIGVVGAFFLSMTLDTLTERFQESRFNRVSLETRKVMNQSAMAMVRDKPLGVGWNNFAKAVNPPYPYGRVIDQWNARRGLPTPKTYARGVVESHYFLLLAETGYLGLITYLLFILAVSWWSLSVAWRHRKSPLGGVAMGILVGFTLTYLHSHLERVLTQTKNLALWIALIGLVGKLYWLDQQERKKNATPLWMAVLSFIGKIFWLGSKTERMPR